MRTEIPSTMVDKQMVTDFYRKIRKVELAIDSIELEIANGRGEYYDRHPKCAKAFSLYRVANGRFQSYESMLSSGLSKLEFQNSVEFEDVEHEIYSDWANLPDKLHNLEYQLGNLENMRLDIANLNMQAEISERYGDFSF